ncbi:MAG: hypothetical protein JST27_01155 [Bacteroidetes bacterium]|nr:hypothetical protein [Bacteroidota bacterium]
MNRKIWILLCFFTLLELNVSAQSGKWGNIWVQGDNVIFTTTFNGSSVPVNQWPYPMTQLFFHGGNSNICDSAGNLILVSDGYNIYDRNLALIEGGDTLVPNVIYNRYDGSSVVQQSSIILPFPNGIYRLITPTASDSEMTNWLNPNSGRALFDLLLYNEIDMNANGGAGKVTKRMAPLLQNVKLSKTQMMACLHGDGQSWWLLKQASDTNMIYKFLFTADSVYGPYVQGFPEPHFTKYDICGQAMFSADGTKYAATVQGAYKVFIADFDRCSGMLSNPKVVEVPPSPYLNPGFNNEADSSTSGLCFSPNGRFLYINGFWSVRQLDLQDNNPATKWSVIAGPDTTWQAFQLYSNIYPGPDGRLYIGNWGGLQGQMSVITNPDAKGSAAGFCPKCLRFPGFLFRGVMTFGSVTNPPCMPNYSLGPTNPICYPTVSVPHEPTPLAPLRIYPNPVSGMLYVEYPASGQLEISDMTSRKVASLTLPGKDGGKASLSLERLPAGVFVCRYFVNGSLRELRKIIVVHE